MEAFVRLNRHPFLSCDFILLSASNPIHSNSISWWVVLVVGAACTVVSNHLLKCSYEQISGLNQDDHSIAWTLPFFCPTWLGHVLRGNQIGSTVSWILEGSQHLTTHTVCDKSVKLIPINDQAYIIFSAGQISQFQDVLYPKCFESYDYCPEELIKQKVWSLHFASPHLLEHFNIPNTFNIYSHRRMLHWQSSPVYKLFLNLLLFAARTAQVVDYIQIVGVMLGMMVTGFLGDLVGRKWGSKMVAAIMLSGAVALAISPFTTGSHAYFIFFLVAQTWYGIGVGGEYPMASSSASEKANVSAEFRAHRGREVTLSPLSYSSSANFSLILYVYNVRTSIFVGGTCIFKSRHGKSCQLNCYSSCNGHFWWNQTWPYSRRFKEGTLRNVLHRCGCMSCNGGVPIHIFRGEWDVRTAKAKEEWGSLYFTSIYKVHILVLATPIRGFSSLGCQWLCILW